MPINTDMTSTASAAETYRTVRRQAWTYLGKGLVFLGVCLFVGQVFETYTLPLYRLVSESSFIAGWVALWRPMELFLYDLPDLRRKMRDESRGRA